MVSSQQAAGSWQSRLAACPGLPATAGCRLPAAGFLPQVTTREGALPPRADVVDELRALLGREALVPVVVDHHDRRAIARAEALDLHQRERPRRVGLAGLDSQLRAQLLGDALGAQETQCWDNRFQAVYTYKPWSPLDNLGTAADCPAIPTL